MKTLDLPGQHTTQVDTRKRVIYMRFYVAVHID